MAVNAARNNGAVAIFLIVPPHTGGAIYESVEKADLFENASRRHYYKKKRERKVLLNDRVTSGWPCMPEAWIRG